MRRISCIIICLAIFCMIFLNCIKAEDTPKTEWIKRYGGYRGRGTDIISTSDGDHIIISDNWTGSIDGSNIWLVKINNDGEEIWNKSIITNFIDIVGSVTLTKDDGYIIVGKSYDNGLVLMKTDEEVNVEWTNTINGSAFLLFDIIQTSDDGYTILGTTELYGNGDEDVWLIKTDNNGNELWNKTFGGSNQDRGNEIKQTSDNGYIIVGRKGLSNGEIYLIKTDENGNAEWEKTYGYWEGCSLEITDDGGYIIAGTWSSSGPPEDDMVLIKTDQNGNIEWKKNIGGEEGEWGQSVIQTNDGGFIISGLTYTYVEGDTDNNVWLIKTDKDGNKIWDRIINDEQDHFWDSKIIELIDGNYFLLSTWYASYGETEGEGIWLAKIPSGEYLFDSEDFFNKTEDAEEKNLSENEGDNTGTPGFEIILILSAITLVFFMKRKRKRG